MNGWLDGLIDGWLDIACMDDYWMNGWINIWIYLENLLYDFLKQLDDLRVTIYS